MIEIKLSSPSQIIAISVPLTFIVSFLIFSHPFDIIYPMNSMSYFYIVFGLPLRIAWLCLFRHVLRVFGLVLLAFLCLLHL
ncbi:MAG: hypothetical protein LBD03_09945 [Methanobrevibacter sp.]|nr:hypothetical protein [Candidatus Methanovirga procula]